MPTPADVLRSAGDQGSMGWRTGAATALRREGKEGAQAFRAPSTFPTKRIGDIIPEEAWSLRKPKVKHLRIFGSITYVKIQEEKQTKLEDKSQKCIILGYCENASGYKLYNPITQKLVVSRDVDLMKNKHGIGTTAIMMT
ncbi:hypothetical protein ZIOFF_051075 [Zingiber officinale]|uniref:Retroviral polymerase SH3-like domain-containing protein n=1 Tax=Zingiber officinale TaxID=94328 RepID=A0A8J5KML4_ZINOF|nr:hypothetical protein ZIOFF_051075 [Zingiber officinale]